MVQKPSRFSTASMGFAPRRPASPSATIFARGRQQAAKTVALSARMRARVTGQ